MHNTCSGTNNTFQIINKLLGLSDSEQCLHWWIKLNTCIIISFFLTTHHYDHKRLRQQVQQMFLNWFCSLSASEIEMALRESSSKKCCPVFIDKYPQDAGRPFGLFFFSHFSVTFNCSWDIKNIFVPVVRSKLLHFYTLLCIHYLVLLTWCWSSGKSTFSVTIIAKWCEKGWIKRKFTSCLLWISSFFYNGGS